MQAKEERLNSLKTSVSTEFTYFPKGIFIPKHLTPTKIHLRALDKLMAGLTKTTRLEKLHHKLNLYSIRASKGARIIGLGDAGRFMVIAFYDNHQYKRLKLINVAGVNHAVIDLKTESEETKAIQQSLRHLKSEHSSYWRKGHFINRKAIYFNDQQEEVINSSALPLVVAGAAGSGKTLIIIRMLFNAYLNGNQRTIYIAPTQRLVQYAQTMFNELIEQLDENQRIESPNVTFMTIRDFICAHKAKDSVLAEPEAVIQWLNAYKTKGKLLRKLLQKPEHILEEFKIISVAVNRKTYLKLGTEQSLFASEEERGACFDLYELYVDKHSNECQIAFPNLDKNSSCFDLMIIDEGQVFTIKQLYEITAFAAQGRFLVFGDPLQNSQNAISVLPQLKQRLCELYHLKDPIVVLPRTYRNPQPVRRFANDVLRVRRHLLAGIHDKCEALELINPLEEVDTDAQPVEWIKTIDETKREELTKLLNLPNALVVTGNDISRQQADKLFNSPTILFADHVQGLEATSVLVYCLFTPELIKRINKQLKGIQLNEDHTHLPKKGQGTHEFTADLDRLFTAVTRVAETKGSRLMIYMGEGIPAHDCELLFSLLTQSMTKGQLKSAATVKAEPVTIEQWKQWVKDLYDSGNDKEAYQVFCKHISNKVDGYNLLVGKLQEQTQSDVRALAAQSQKRSTITVKPIPKSAAPKIASPKDPVKTDVSKQLYASSALRPALATGNTQTKMRSSDRLTDKEVSYLNGLLNTFILENVNSLLKHKGAERLMFTPFRVTTSSKMETLYNNIISSPAFLSIFIQAIRADLFLSVGKILKSPFVIYELEIKLGALLNRPLDNTPIESHRSHINELVAPLFFFLESA